MTIRLASGISPNYVSRAEQFIKSLTEHCNVDTTIFGVNFPLDTTEINGVKCIPLDYSKAPVQFPKVMLQSGMFVLYAPSDWQEDDIIIFTDADAYFQRGFNESEISTFLSIPDGTMMVGYNKPNEDQSLLSESYDLFPKKPMDEIKVDFPNMENMVCRNFGMVIAKLSTWRELNNRTLNLWSACDSCFDNPARVQLVSLYACQLPGMSIVDLPADCHAHGHHGIKIGLERGVDGLWRQDGNLVAFAHAL